jgi:hypothetical protein
VLLMDFAPRRSTCASAGGSHRRSARMPWTPATRY